ncbi:hypothetical protein PR048_020243 [Dryococelus australis]|uniref:COX assembly mitochondrial protein n=1 Tax=Dryococelus australis TaxID=614101 RepID=A0ABQ9H5R8_9NEOP|nr:hypothetical protein PR048_020243 [Dryococelus australis]
MKLVMVLPQKEDQSRQETRAILHKSLDPMKDGLKIKHIYSLRTYRLLIESKGMYEACNQMRQFKAEIREHNHREDFWECPLYIQAYKQELARTNYGC